LEVQESMEDFRNDDQRKNDRKLVGTWWRCPSHGTTDSPILLSSVAYCPTESCAAQVKLVHSAINDPNANAQARSVWRKSSDLFLPPAEENT
jgi:hypothetical protein